MEGKGIREGGPIWSLAEKLDPSMLDSMEIYAVHALCMMSLSWFVAGWQLLVPNKRLESPHSRSGTRRVSQLSVCQLEDAVAHTSL